MNRRFPKACWLLVLSAMTLVVMATAASAGPFISDFTNPAWTVNDSTTVTLAPTTATIAENQSQNSVTLSQSFMIPANPTTLQFSIINLTTDMVENGVTPAFFSADLLDTMGHSLVPAIAASTDYYARDLTDPTFSQNFGMPGVNVSPLDGATTPIAVSLDISSLAANTVVNLQFSLVSANGDPSLTNASVEISDVLVNGGTVVVPTIPEPGSIVLLSIAILGVTGHFYFTRRAASVSDR